MIKRKVLSLVLAGSLFTSCAAPVYENGVRQAECSYAPDGAHVCKHFKSDGSINQIEIDRYSLDGKSVTREAFNARNDSEYDCSVVTNSSRHENSISLDDVSYACWTKYVKKTKV